MTRGRRSKNKEWVENKIYIANRSLKFRVHRHTLLEKCVDKIVFLSRPLTYQSEQTTTFLCYDIDLPFECQVD
jgi:hypothetical protein